MRESPEYAQRISDSARSASRRALADLLSSAAGGQFPPSDGGRLILGQPAVRDAGVISFTGFAVIFADADPGWIAAQLPAGDLSAPLSASFLHVLGRRLGRESHSTDMLTCAGPLPGGPPRELMLVEVDPARPGQPLPRMRGPGGPEPSAAASSAAASSAPGPAAPEPGPAASSAPGPGAPGPSAQHARIARALRYRDHVRAWRADGGVVTLGRGVAGRWEVSVEVGQEFRGGGLGSRLASAARHLVPDGAPLWAQIAPGNAASVRAFLRAGFRPVGAEALLAPADGQQAAGAPAGADATMSSMSEVAVTDNQDESRLEITADGQHAELVYRTRAGRLILVHTEVPDALGGRGLGGALVRAAIRKATAEGMTLVPLCPFARDWLERHPDEAVPVAIDPTAR